MENTSESMYKYFLTLIRKERTTVVPPVKWNEWINSILLDWVKTKLPENQFIQKRIDDLEAIRFITDGSQAPEIVPLPPYTSNIFPIPYESTIAYPKYMWGISAKFMIGEEIRWGKIFRSDTSGPIKNNPFRQTNDTDFVYFENRGGNIYVKNVGTFMPYDKLVLEYYTYPKTIVFDPDDNGINTAGSFQLTQNQEVVELAARKYLERITDPRWQSFTQEQMSVPS